MLFLLQSIASGLFSVASDWFKNKRELSKAKHESKLAKIKQDVDWESTMAQGSMSSWKDEFWTLVLAAPLVLYWISALFDLPLLQDRIDNAFKRMNDLPEWYLIGLGIAIAAAFGIRSFIGAMKNGNTK